MWPFEQLIETINGKKSMRVTQTGSIVKLTELNPNTASTITVAPGTSYNIVTDYEFDSRTVEWQLFLRGLSRPTLELASTMSIEVFQTNVQGGYTWSAPDGEISFGGEIKFSLEDSVNSGLLIAEGGDSLNRSNIILKDLPFTQKISKFLRLTYNNKDGGANHIIGRSIMLVEIGGPYA